ncbi:MAG: bifunctional 3-deoxy-7-phosphoheptulonate synthase/chorismate mutase type II [Alistipes sp.]|nr:bifunctional 3-deoxy-7-phosphoheptulonate synthase/chorismate mutase type II [Alistipes sp.]
MFDDLRPIDAVGQRTSPLYIAGPCSAESREQMLATARGVAACGVDWLRAGVWKPRTKPGGFEGMGDVALEWLAEAKAVTGLRTMTEIATPRHLEAALRSGVDGVWIGARTTTNPFAVQQIADALQGIDIPVLVKNPVNPDVNLWIGSIERIYNAGIRRLAAIHRGFGSYEPNIYRNPPQWSVAFELRRQIPSIPIICDPSHIGGRADLVAPLAQQALDMGFDGLMIESHCSPEYALSDSAQQLTPDALRDLIGSIRLRRTPDAPDAMRDFRMQIDAIDNRLIELLAERMSIAREIGRYKSQHGMPIVHRDRFNEILEAASARAVATRMSSKFICRIITDIHEESVRQQWEVSDKKQRSM